METNLQSIIDAARGNQGPAQAAPKPVSSAILQAFYEGKDARDTDAKVGEVEQSRIKYLLSFFPHTSLAEMQAAARGYRKDAKGTTREKTVRQRMVEAQALYGAWKFAGWQYQGGRYHAVVAEAYAALQSKQIKANGDHLKDKFEKEVDKKAAEKGEIEKRQFKALEMARRKAEQAGEELTPEQATAIRESEADAVLRSGAVKMAETLLKRKGVKFCLWLVESLGAGIDAVISEKAEKLEKAA